MQTKELIKLANELDSRGLAKEADLLDKIAADISNVRAYHQFLRETYNQYLSMREPLPELRRLFIKALEEELNEATKLFGGDRLGALTWMQTTFETEDEEHMKEVAETHGTHEYIDKLLIIPEKTNFTEEDIPAETVIDWVKRIVNEHRSLRRRRDKAKIISWFYDKLMDKKI
jgi:hypothetical protein